MDERTENGDGPTGDSLAALPSFESFHIGDDGRPLDPRKLYESFICEECDELKSDVVGYSLLVIFLVPRGMRVIFMVKCRTCMRRHIRARIWLAILLAHVFSPAIFVWWIAVDLQTFYRKPA